MKKRYSGFTLSNRDKAYIRKHFGSTTHELCMALCKRRATVDKYRAELFRDDEFMKRRAKKVRLKT